jgi:hypothetical protein
MKTSFTVTLAMLGAAHLVLGRFRAGTRQLDGQHSRSAEPQKH